MRKLALFLLPIILYLSACTAPVQGVANWATRLSAEEITNAEAWTLNPYYTTTRLSQAEIDELVSIINSLDVSNFTEDTSLSSVSGEYGVVIYIRRRYFSITQSESRGNGRLEMMYNNKRWLINDDLLNEFIIRKSGWVSMPVWDQGISPAGVKP